MFDKKLFLLKLYKLKKNMSEAMSISGIDLVGNRNLKYLNVNVTCFK